MAIPTVIYLSILVYYNAVLKLFICDSFLIDINFLQVVESNSSRFYLGPSYKSLVMIKLTLVSLQFNKHVPLVPHILLWVWHCEGFWVQTGKQDRHEPCPQGSYNSAAKSDAKDVITTQGGECYNKESRQST